MKNESSNPRYVYKTEPIIGPISMPKPDELSKNPKYFVCSCLYDMEMTEYQVVRIILEDAPSSALMQIQTIVNIKLEGQKWINPYEIIAHPSCIIPEISIILRPQ